MSQSQYTHILPRKKYCPTTPQERGEKYIPEEERVDIHEQSKKAQAAAAAAAIVAYQAHLLALDSLARARIMVEKLAKKQGAKAKSLLVREVPFCLT